MTTEAEMMATLFKAPVLRTLPLDRSKFCKTVKLVAAVIHESKNISPFRRQMSATHELLKIKNLNPIQEVFGGKKSLLLNPQVKIEETGTWSPALKGAVEAGEVSLTHFDTTLDYSFWDYLDIMKSVLPTELHVEIPVGFNTAAHLNLREQYLPYKSVIAEVLLDKIPNIRTVINKIEVVGYDDQFRTFPYEVLAGPDDLEVEVSEHNCTFNFDYGLVYWNSKLEQEHSRLVDMFQPGEVVCDAMGGVGPFAIPAGKKGVFVLANDLNPASYKYLNRNIERNKVSKVVFPFNEDGGAFIRRSGVLAQQEAQCGHSIEIKPKLPKNWPQGKQRPLPTTHRFPPTVSHYVMNLPGSAITFLHHFRGAFRGLEHLYTSSDSLSPAAADGHPPKARLPLIHVHCFHSDRDDGDHREALPKRIQEEIGVLLTPGHDATTVDGQVNLFNVRDVAPNKRMYCATFRLPWEVAFEAEGK